MWRRFLLVAVLLTGFTAFAFSQARPVLGILPFTGGSGGDGEAIATIIAMEPEIMRAFTVVPRNLAAVLLPFVMRRKICYTAFPQYWHCKVSFKVLHHTYVARAAETEDKRAAISLRTIAPIIWVGVLPVDSARTWI